MKKTKSPCFCINVRRASGAITDLYNRFLEPVQLTISQFSILRNIDRMESCNVSELAERIGLDRTSVVRMLRPLTDAMLIVDVSQEGTRSRKLVLSEHGKTVLAQAIPCWENAQQEIERRIGKEQMEIMLSVIEQLESE